MEFLNYSLAIIVSYLGLFAGYLLIFFAPEEKKPGMKYFNALNYIVFLLAAFLAAYFNLSNIAIILLVILAILFFLFFREYQIYISYLFFSFMLAFLSKSSAQFLAFSTTVFAYGLISGAIIIDLKDKKKSLWKLFSLSYFILSALIFKLIL